MAAGARLTIHPDALRDAAAHAARERPLECCGGLLGGDAQGVRHVRAAAPAVNAHSAEGRASSRYLIPAEAVMALESEAGREGLELVGFYHSHPRGAARPSDLDRELAWPWYTYLIVGPDGRALAWTLRDDRTGFEPVAVRVASAGAA